jgi:hypothetical protein
MPLIPQFVRQREHHGHNNAQSVNDVYGSNVYLLW